MTTKGIETMSFTQVKHLIDVVLSEYPGSETTFYYYVGHKPTTEEPSRITLRAVIGSAYPDDTFVPNVERDIMARILSFLDYEKDPIIKENNAKDYDCITSIYEFRNFIVEITGIITLL